MKMSRVLLVEFSGWITVDAKNAKFVCIGSESEEFIDGEQWLDLTQEERSNYLICMQETEDLALDGCYEQLDIEENKE
jgi:hypothetical protein